MFPVDKVSDDKIDNKKIVDTSDERKAFDTFDDEDDDKKPEEKKDDSKKEDEEEDDDREDDDKVTKEDEDEDEDNDEDDDDEVTDEDKDEEVNESDSLYQQVKKTSPDLFKKIPELKRVLFREAAYTEVFPTVDEAKEALETSQLFNTFQNDITGGNSEKLLVALEKVDKKSLESFAANFFPTLENVNKDVYLGVLYPEFKKMLRAAVKSGNKSLVTSAENLNWFIFGDTDVDKEAGLKPKAKDEREDKFSKREQEFEERIYKSFAQDVGSSTKGRTMRLISNAFKDSGMSEWQVKKVTEDIFTRLDEQISKDPRHMGLINSLWKQAKSAGFTSEYKERISNAYLSRAKLLIPQVRQKVLFEAKVSAKLKTEDKKRPTRISAGSGARSPVGSKKVDPKKIDWDKTSERDLLDGVFTEKK